MIRRENQEALITIIDFKAAFDTESQKFLESALSRANFSITRRNINDHLLILNGIINSVIKGGEESIDIQVFNIEKAFDSIWLEDSVNDVYDSLTEDNRNEKLLLLYKMNHLNLVGIRTSFGLTTRANIPDITQQGGV